MRERRARPKESESLFACGFLFLLFEFPGLRSRVYKVFGHGFRSGVSHSLVALREEIADCAGARIPTIDWILNFSLQEAKHLFFSCYSFVFFEKQGYSTA
jgi:hypothetical protein